MCCFPGAGPSPVPACPGAAEPPPAGPALSRRRFPVGPTAAEPVPPWGPRSPPGAAEPWARTGRTGRGGAWLAPPTPPAPRLFEAWLLCPANQRPYRFALPDWRGAGGEPEVRHGTGAERGERRMSKGREGPAAGGECAEPPPQPRRPR